MKGGLSMSTFDFTKAISPCIKALPQSGLAKFLEITASNPDIVPLSVGEPDFDVPAKVREATIESILAGKSSYTSTLGLLELRKAIADDTFNNYGVAYDPQTEIMVTVGVSEALYVVLRLF
jgi:aminotransferase